MKVQTYMPVQGMIVCASGGAFVDTAEYDAVAAQVLKLRDAMQKCLALSVLDHAESARLLTDALAVTSNECAEEITKLRQENQRLLGALSDCNGGLNTMAAKIVAVGSLIGFLPDQDVEAIAAIIRSKLDEFTSAQQRLEDAQKIIASRREVNFGVDASPDEGLPVRILRAYLEDGYTTSMPARMGELINQWTAERNAILQKAIAKLSTETEIV